MRFPKISGRNPFAHLNRVRAEDDDDRNRSDDVADDRDEDDQEEEDEERNPSSRARRSAHRRAEEDDDETSAEDQDKEDESADEDEGDDRTDADDDDDSKTARIRSRERGRCAYIFRSKSAARNPAAAAQIAFGTTLPRRQAVALLRSLNEAPPPQRGQERPGASLRSRMRQNPVGAVGMDRQASPEQRPGMSIVAACKKFSTAPRGN